MNLILTLTWRNLWRNRKRTIITMSSVMFAVLLAIAMASMQRGIYDRMIENMVKYSTGYIQVQDVMYRDEPSIDHTMLFDDAIKEILKEHDEQIAFYVPRLEGFVLTATEDKTRAARLIGIDPESEIMLNDLSDNMVEGNFLRPGDNGILVAEGMAAILEVSVGDTLVLLGQGFQGMTAAGKYPVQGIIDLKIPELNNSMLYMSLKTAQWFFGSEQRLTSLIVMPENPHQTRVLAKSLLGSVDPQWYTVYTWEVLLRDILDLMKFDMAGGQMMMVILFIVIAFGLFGTIVMMMIERKKEFGLLFSLGVKRRLLATVCFFEALFISVMGSLAGLLLSIPLVAYYYFNPVLLTGDMAQIMAEYGFEPVMPASVEPSVFYVQVLMILALSFLIGLYPVYKVYRLKIMEVKH